MKTLKWFAAAWLITLAAAANAQSGQAAHEACHDLVKARMELLAKELALDQEQAAKVQHLLAENEESVTRGHCAVMDAKAKKQDEATYASISALLTGEQQQKFKHLQSEGRLDACGKDAGKGCCAGAKDGAKAQGTACEGRGAAPAKGCCAGKAGAEKAN